MPFEGGNSQVRIAVEPFVGMPPAVNSGWFDLQFSGAELGGDFARVKSGNLAPGSQRQRGNLGKIPVLGSIKGEPFPDRAFGMLVGEGQRKVTTTTLATGVYNHRMGPTEAVSFPSLASRVSRDDGAPGTIADAAVDGFDLSLEPNKAPEFSFSLVAERTARWGPAIATVGTVTASKYAVLRGLPSAALLALADGKIFAKVVAATSATSITVKVKIGAAATYDGVDIVIPCGPNAAGNPQWVRLTDENDVRIGEPGMYIEMAVSTGTGFAVNDILTFARESATWTTTGPTMLALNEIYAEIRFDDAAYCITSFKLSAKYPVAALDCIGGRFAPGLYRSGEREISITVDRRPDNLTLMNRLITGETFALVVTIGNGQEVAPGFDFLLTITCPLCEIEGKETEATADLKESVKISCNQSPGDASGYVDDMTIELVNGVASLVSFT